MTEQENYDKFIEFVGILLEKSDSRNWLGDKLVQKIAEHIDIDELSKSAILKNINEQCIEDILTKQAKEFYEDFAVKELKPKLIADFKKMESQRRKDDFDEFCLAMFQQIEGIINFLFNKHLSLKIEALRGMAVFGRIDNESKQWIRNTSGYRFDQLIFRVSAQTEFSSLDSRFEKVIGWTFKEKLRSIVYFYYFNSKLDNLSSLNIICENIEQIYQGRNQNHRGTEENQTTNQKQVLDRINSNKSRSYLLFYGYFSDFILKINETLIEMKGLEKSKIDNTGKPSEKKGVQLKKAATNKFSDIPGAEKLTNLFDI